VTSRPLGLAFLLAAVAALEALRRGGGLAALGLLAGTVAISASFSPLIGLPGGLAIAGGLAGSALLPLSSGETQGELRAWRRRAGAAIAALALGLLLAAPTYVHLFARAGGSAVEIGVTGETLIGVVSSAGLLLALAGLGAVLGRGSARRLDLALLAACVALLLGAAVLELPVANQCNFLHAAGFLLALPAAAALQRLSASGTRARVAAGIGAALVFLPTPAVVVLSYLGRPAIPLRIEGRTLVRTPADDPRALLQRWAREVTPPDAVFVTDPRPPLETAVGNAPEFPALSGRTIFTAQATSYLVTPNRDADRRLELAARLVDGGAPAEADEVLLRDLGRPLWLVTRHGDDSVVRAALEARWGPPDFAAGPYAAFRVRPAPAQADGQGRR
jgi:hypothetical protein